MLTLQRYDLKVKYRPGVDLSLTDALSRSYLPETTETLIPDQEVNEVHLTTHLPVSPEKYVEFQQATAADPAMQALSSIIQPGWPKSKEDVPNALRQYWDYRNELSSVHLEHSDLLVLTAGEKKCLTASMNRIKVLSSSNTERETCYSGPACHLRLKIRCPSVPYVANSREHIPRHQ